MLDRKKINIIRYILEDILPAFIRDSGLFLVLMYLVYGKNLKKFVSFREKALTLTNEEYKEFYKMFHPIMGETDLNKECIDRILDKIEGANCLDVGCGRGYLTNQISNKKNIEVVGVDINTTDLKPTQKIKYVNGFATELPFPDKSFDTVVCTHTLEHIIDFNKAVSELRRVSKKRLIVVVPKEREYKYSFNLHVSFFPYLNTFTKRIQPPLNHEIMNLGGDIYYQEEISQ